MRRLRNILLITTALMPVPALAGPVGGQVVGGSAQINNPGTANVTINQFSDKAIINWHMFNIGVGEKTTFVQPNSNAIALNRVVGGLGPSEILGTLDANGKVFIVNKDGIIFGPGAVINTAGFLATTSDIRNEDFMAGRFNFNVPGRPDASIVNMGTITATSGGFAALVAPGVRNSGTITANLGTVTLASGNMFNLDFYGDKLVQLGFGDEIAGKVKDVATGQTLKSLVTNEGKLKANGGRVELTAAAARQVVDSVINTSGVIEANSVGVKNGQIVLAAATAASKSIAPGGRGAAPTAVASLPPQKVKVSGTLSAAGKKAGTKGGTITITGEHIEVAGATMDASGREGGGKVLIGGDWAGGKPDASLVSNQSAKLESNAVPTATTLTVDAATTIDASAKDKGDGGKVILWSDQTTSFAGTILALGGAQFGNGGFVETSGKGQLNFAGNVDTRAPNGMSGTLLLDPTDYYIVATAGTAPTGASEITNTALQTQLASNNVTLATSSADQLRQNGDIFVNAPVVWNASTTLTLSAIRNVDIAFVGTNGRAIQNTGAGNLIIRADNTGAGNGTINLAQGTFSERVDWSASTGKVSFYYNPTSYLNPTNFTIGNGKVVANGSVPNQFTAYMLINNASAFDTTAANNIALNLGGTYALGRNIDLSKFTGFAAGTTFTGTLTGNGGLGTNSTISGLATQLFPMIGTNGKVSDLNLANVDISATANNQFIGPLAGQNSGTITNVHVLSGTVSGGSFTGINAGGLVGQNTGNLSIHNSSSAATITVGDGVTGPGGGFNSAGGLAGQNIGTIANSTASGNVTGGTNSFVGGLSGTNGAGGTISGTSLASGNVSGSGSVGGLVGFNANGASITNASASGNVTGTSSTAMVGGLVGQNEGTISNSTHATGTISGNGAGLQNIILGGLVGMNGGLGTISNSTVSGATINGNIATAGGLVGINSGQITGSSPGQVSANTTITLNGANSIGGGLVGTNNAGAVIQNASAGGSLNRAVGSEGLLMNFGGLVGWNLGSIDNSTASTAVNGGSGTAGGLAGRNEGSITASSASGNVSATGESFQFAWVGGLAGDNTATGTITNSSATGNVSTGGFANIGGLIGNNSANVSNLSAGNTVSGTGQFVSLGGLIGTNNAGATITNGTSTANVSGGDNSSVGGLVGTNLGTIANSSTSGQVSGGSLSTVGGLVGTNSGEVTGSQSSVAINLSNAMSVGGLVGMNDSGGSIANSSATGAVSGSTFTIGGLVGANAGSISGSSATGNVTGGPASTSGGFAGFNTGSIENSNASGNVTGGEGSTLGGLVGMNAGTITNSFGTGAVNADPSIAGGLVGINIGTIAGSHATGAVTGDDGSLVGGLVAFNILGSIQNSYSVSTVTTGMGGGAGGLVAINMGNISQSFATGKVTGGDASYVGGLVAFNFGDPTNSSPSPVGVISQSYATGAVTGGATSVVGGLVAENAGSLDQTYAAGRVTGGTGSILGGLVASNNFNLPDGNPLFPPNAAGTTGTATNSYWDTQTTGQSTSAGGTGLQTAQLVNVIPSGFAASAWSTSPGSYPFLAGQPSPLPVPGDPVVNPPPPPPPPPQNPPQQQPPPDPDRPIVDNTTIVLISPQANVGAALTGNVTAEPKSSELVINNQSGSGGSGGSGGAGGTSPGGQKGGGQSGNAGRPPANVVAAYGLGPLPSGMPPLKETRFLNDEVVFQLGGRLSDQELTSLLNQLGLQVMYQEDVGLLGRRVLRLKLPGGATVRNIIAQLEKKGVNFSAQPSYQFELTQDLAQAPSPADTRRRGDSAQYIVEKLGLPEAHLIATGKDVKVAVIDSEIDRQHPDLVGAIADNFDALPSDEKTAHPHGTGMAGAIASHRRLLGIAPNARILGVRAFGVNTGGAQGTSMNIVKGLQWAVDQGARVINMSFAGPKDPILQQAMQRLTDQGIILIAAAGNAGPKSPALFPGADRNVIAVSATDVDNKTYKNANRGDYVAISAPGVDILVPAPEGGYQLTTGTSVAAAHISGVVALMLERNKELKPAEVRSILTATAKNIGGVKKDVGAGLVDPAAALGRSGPKSARLQ